MPLNSGKRQDVSAYDTVLAIIQAAREGNKGAPDITGSGTPGVDLGGGTGTGSSAIAVEEANVSVVAAATTLNFAGADFNVTDAGSGQADIALASSGATALVVQEGDVDVDITVSTLDFDATAFNITESPEDEANIALNFGTGAGQPAEGNHTHSLTSSNISDFAEASQDQIGAHVKGAGYASVSYDDAGTGDTTITVAKHEMALTWSINEGGVPSLGDKNPIVVPFAATIKRWYVLADGLGDLTLDVWKDTYGNWPIGNASSIVASAKPTLAAASKGSDSTLTGWTTSISANDVLVLEVESAEAIGFFTFALIVERT